eukprot:354034-Karenia_brevis.AAC.1
MRSRDQGISLEEADKLNEEVNSEPIFRDEVSENDMEINSEKTTASHELARICLWGPWTEKGLGEQSEAKSESRRANANENSIRAETLNGNLNNESRTIFLTEQN